ncbi:MAG: acyl transferase, partial [Flavobacteriaceae bacterium]
LLIGVTYALLDLADRFQRPLKNTVVMETGGMKGRRKELVRQEVHAQLKKAFGLNSIHSEYGMTELLSQAYSKGEGVFETPPWMRVLIREAEDPFTYMPIGRTGGINVIDFANVHSCSFIATDDLGRLNSDKTFEVLGRFDSAELRGCNLMMA